MFDSIWFDQHKKNYTVCHLIDDCVHSILFQFKFYNYQNCSKLIQPHLPINHLFSFNYSHSSLLFETKNLFFIILWRDSTFQFLSLSSKMHKSFLISARLSALWNSFPHHKRKNVHQHVVSWNCTIYDGSDCTQCTACLAKPCMRHWRLSCRTCIIKYMMNGLCVCAVKWVLLAFQSIRLFFRSS